jgi:hypothetical protein
MVAPCQARAAAAVASSSHCSGAAVGGQPGPSGKAPAPAPAHVAGHTTNNEDTLWQLDSRQLWLLPGRPLGEARDAAPDDPDTELEGGYYGDNEGVGPPPDSDSDSDVVQVRLLRAGASVLQASRDVPALQYYTPSDRCVARGRSSWDVELSPLGTTSTELELRGRFAGELRFCARPGAGR